MSTLIFNRSAVKSTMLFLLSFGVALAAPGRDWSQWMSQYYRTPQPDQVVKAVYGLSKSGYFERAENRTAAIGFFAGVFSQNPDRVGEWMSEFRNLPVAEQRLVAAALWYSGLPQGREHLLALARNSRSDMRADIEQLVQQKMVSLRDTPVLSESSLNLQWGAFLATGESQHVVNVLAALGSREPGLSNQARFALAQNAAAHQRVYEICQNQLSRQPQAVQEQLHAVLAEAQPRM
jgi:hypothetical protein